MQKLFNLLEKYIRKFSSFKLIFIFFFSFIFSFFFNILGLDIFISFCEDDLVNNKSYNDDDNNWLTEREREDLKVSWEIILNVLKLLILLFSLAGFTVLLLVCIVVFDIANAHNYSRPS